MRDTFTTFRAFDFAQANIHLWVFKKSSTVQKFSAHYVPTDETLTGILRNLVQTEIVRITEFTPYSYLSETNENSCLATQHAGTDFEELKREVDHPETERRARGLIDLKNAEGYLVKFTHNAETVYAVKRSTATWKTAYQRRFINIVFTGGELSTVEDNGFTIEKNFDFFCKGNFLFIANKRGFESALSYKTGYTRAFSLLQQTPGFSTLFTDLQPLIEYVGTNATQLRRMATVEQKALYERPEFLPNLQAVSARHQWGINFDPATNRIVPCADTARTIMQVLLDHRLMSEITSNIYDVPDAVPV